MERKIGAKNFTWNESFNLRDLAKKSEKIRQDRVNKIVKAIIKLGQLSMFEDLDSYDDILSVVSCGLFCGK